jgi:DNA-binding NarL/FixJ family response regulator
MTNEEITIMIVDDHELVRRGAVDFLKVQPHLNIVAQAESGEEAVRLAQEYIPDVVLMDLILPGISGVEATRKIKDISPRSQIIVLTSYHDDEYIFPSLQAGAISYLLKDVKAAELIAAIERAAKGEATLHPRIAGRVITQINQDKSEQSGPFAELTNREIEVLKLIAKGLTNQNIADQLFITIGTVKGHVSNILSKLQLADRTQAAVCAWQEGIMHSEK